MRSNGRELTFYLSQILMLLSNKPMAIIFITIYNSLYETDNYYGNLIPYILRTEPIRRQNLL